MLLLPSVLSPAGSVRLIESNGLEGEYACLSYCWGTSEQTAKTTTDKLSQYDLGIRVSDLPKTIIDTIRLCHSLGFRYLWIDALCIIQDDEEDWLREASKMCEIFSKSALTIATPICGDSSESFVEKRRAGLRMASSTAKIVYRDKNSGMLGSFSLRLQKRVLHYGNGLWFLENDWYKLVSMNKSPHTWLGRAWTLQEWMLSPRVLHIHEMTLWDCLGGYGNEVNRRFLSRPCLDRYSHSSSSGYAIPWQIIVEEYTSRAMTKAEDRLPALAGLAAQYSKKTGYKYVTGLWSEELPITLLWSVDISSRFSREQHRPYGHGGPSWSWASLAGPVYFHCVLTQVDVKISNCTAIEPPDYSSSATVFSAISIKTIELTGFICRVTALVNQPEQLYLGSRESLDTESEVVEAWKPKLDHYVELSEQDIDESNIYLLLVATEGPDSCPLHYSLLLRWHDREGKLHRFRRLGIASLTSQITQTEELVGDWKRKTIYIR